MRNVARILVAVLLLGLPLAGCEGDQLPPASQYSSFSGVIVDAATNQPIAGAVVTVDTVLTATTDKDGKFTIDKVPSGIVDYIVQAQGYKLVSASSNAEPGKMFVLNVSMQQKPPQE